MCMKCRAKEEAGLRVVLESWNKSIANRQEEDVDDMINEPIDIDAFIAKLNPVEKILLGRLFLLKLGASQYHIAESLLQAGMVAIEPHVPEEMRHSNAQGSHQH